MPGVLGMENPIPGRRVVVLSAFQAVESYLLYDDEAAAQQLAVSKNQLEWLDGLMVQAGSPEFICCNKITINDVFLYTQLDWFDNFNKGAIKKEKDSSGQKALADMTIFPVIMLVFYIGLIFHFNAKGGYKPLVLGADGETSEAGDDDTSDEGEEEKEPEKDD